MPSPVRIYLRDNDGPLTPPSAKVSNLICMGLLPGCVGFIMRCPLSYIHLKCYDRL